MDTLCDVLPIKSVDIRSAINVSPSTLSETYKKLDVKYIPNEKSKSAGKSISGLDARTILESRGYTFPKQAQVVSFSVCKGGAGKTTSAFYVGQRLSSYGARVLIVDSDMQGNLTAAFQLGEYGISINEETPILVDVFSGDIDINEIIIPYSSNLHLIPSTPMNSRLENTLSEKFKNPSTPFNKLLKPLKNSYDYILIDCAPAFNLVNTAIACASDTTVLLANPDEFSRISISQTLSEFNDIEEEFSLKINKKILFSKFDQREKVSMKYLAEIVNEHGDKLFGTMIRTASDVKNAIANNECLFDYKKSNAREDYDNLVKEIMGIDKLFTKKIVQ